MHIGVITSKRDPSSLKRSAHLETRVVTGVETGVLTGRGCTSADTIYFLYPNPNQVTQMRSGVRGGRLRTMVH